MWQTRVLAPQIQKELDECCMEHLRHHLRYCYQLYHRAGSDPSSGDFTDGIFLLIGSILGLLGVMNFGLGEATLRYVARYYGEGDWPA